MHSLRFDRLLAGTAVALALALTTYSGAAIAKTDAEISAAVPMPATADLAPPTEKDISPDPAETTATTPTASTPAPSTPAPAATEVTNTPAAAVSTATTALATDAAIVEKLREHLSAGKFDRILGGKKERGAIEAFYAGRGFAPLWIADGVMNQRAKAAVAYLSGVEADGLEPSDYPIPSFKAGAEPDALAEAEIKFTDTVLTFARQAQTGRVHYTRVSGDIFYDIVRTDPAEVLVSLAKGNNAGEVLDSHNPPQPGYKALKAKLAAARNSTPDAARPRVPNGPVLKYSKNKKGEEVLMADARVPALRERFGLKAPEGDTKYDKPLSGAIAKFQKENGLSPTGQLNAAAIEAINGPRRERDVDVIVANMERWRWMPRDLGKTYVMVNIPDYSLRVVRDNKLVWKTKIVVGKPNLATPLISADMKFITVNPTWNVPPSIIQNEYLPALQQDPQALDRIGLKIMQNPDGTVRIWQPPGDRNALGRIRFNFPNKFLVYQHDTPDKHLFAHDKRAYSHGCMRVENPLKYGEVLLSLALPNEKYSEDRLRSMFGGSEININFPTNIPVHITYQTAFVDDADKLVIRDDIYGRDARMLATMKGSERKVADIAIERPKNTSAAPVRVAPGTYGGGGFSSGSSFFERIFGGAEAAEAPRPRSRVGRANDRQSFR